MFLPIGDEPNPRVLPLVNYALIAANVCVFLFISLPLTQQAANPSDPHFAEYLRVLAGEHPGTSMRLLAREVSAYQLFTFTWGFRPAMPSLPTLFASLFLHGGWLHL